MRGWRREPHEAHSDFGCEARSQRIRLRPSCDLRTALPRHARAAWRTHDHIRPQSRALRRGRSYWQHAQEVHGMGGIDALRLLRQGRSPIHVLPCERVGRQPTMFLLWRERPQLRSLHEALGRRQTARRHPTQVASPLSPYCSRSRGFFFLPNRLQWNARGRKSKPRSGCARKRSVAFGRRPFVISA